jgi:porphobilinogen synthase
MTYPEHRPRRLRRNEEIRRMVRETKLSVDDLIYPLFAAAGKKVRKEIPSMPGVFQVSVENLVKEVREVRRLGIPAVLRSRTPSPTSRSSPTSASANTPTTASAGFSPGKAMWTTTLRWTSWPAAH